MKKIYFVGDVRNDTGPAIVNKCYKKYLGNEAYFLHSNNKILRIVDFFLKMPFCKYVIISGFSKLNYFMAVISKLFFKRTIYLMHGYIKQELELANRSNQDKVKIELKLLHKVDKIICVSNFFHKYLKQSLPQFSDKIDYVNNGVKFPYNTNKKKINEEFKIISVGGGVKQKNNIVICKALEQLNISNLKYIVVGKIAEDGDEIKKYTFVEYYEYLEHDKLLSLMNLCDLYIQNSSFETFGLAICEAIGQGCDLLISQNVGALDVIENIKDDSIIFDNNNVKEVSRKILKKISCRSTFEIDLNKNSWELRSKELIEKLRG